MQINNIPPPPIDNDPPPSTDEGKKKLQQFISKAVWGSFKTWLATQLTAAVNQILQLLQNVTFDGNKGVGSINGLPATPGMAQMRNGQFNFPAAPGWAQGANNGVNNIPPGFIGEQKFASYSGATLVSNSIFNGCQITLTPGIWAVYTFAAITNTGPNMNNVACGFNTVNTSFGALGSYFQLSTTAVLGTVVFQSPIQFVAITTNTTYFSIVFAGFAAGTTTASGQILAWRLG